ncbi:hypothetical protein [Hymenobacter koreensis]|uniref:hypothetical protein n=1 Tax=Hymenobacter koreensis TaxID=1084523 RepID=UPI0031EA2611
MKKILLEPVLPANTIAFPQVNKFHGIFAKKDGKLIGMLLPHEDGGYVVQLSLSSRVVAHHNTMSLKDSMHYFEARGYEFFQEV